MERSVTLRTMGLMSGTSVDGIDAAVAEIAGTGPSARVDLVGYNRYPYPSRTREAIFQGFDNTSGGVDGVSTLNFVLGELFAAAAIDLVENLGLKLSDVDLMGSHGHTVSHQPDAAEVGGMWTVSTLQIGEPTVIAERTGVTTVADFRCADMAAGGQGSPLAPYVDFVLFRSQNRTRAVQNIGGTGNVTYIPAGGRMEQVIAFDTGPGNMLIDAVVWRTTEGTLACDMNGGLALAGRINGPLLRQLLKHPFLEKRPPKSAGFEEFGTKFAEKLLADSPGMSAEDMVATVTGFTAESIARGYEKWFPKRPDDVILGGRGARNRALMRMLTESLPGAKLMMHEDFGINGDAKEALAFAFLASETVRGRPGNLPSTTGAKHPVVLGKIVPGRNFGELMHKLGDQEAVQE